MTRKELARQLNDERNAILNAPTKWLPVTSELFDKARSWIGGHWHYERRSTAEADWVLVWSKFYPVEVIGRMETTAAKGTVFTLNMLDYRVQRFLGQLK